MKSLPGHSNLHSRVFSRLILLVCAIGLMSHIEEETKKLHIYLAGDSTMSIKETKFYPETGWGMPFVHFWDSSVSVVNRAKNGRSTRTFITEGWWQSICEDGKDGDYVFIQFGHNDEVPSKKSYTTEQEFSSYLLQYIKDAKDRKMIPVLLTPVARRKFDSTGHIVGTHEVYSQLVRNVAAQYEVTIIDLDKQSQALYQQMGAEDSKLLFLQLKPGEHPNYPEGKEDNTHFSELGARLIAQLVLQEIKTRIPALAKKIYVPAISK